MNDILPYATHLETPIEGALKSRPEDFVVEEIPAYEPSGEGEHLYVFFEKRGIDTREAVRRLARTLGVDAKDAGTAGMKDRHAVTRQWASFLRGDAQRIEGAELDDVRVLSSSKHGNKLRTGHLRGNRFRIRLRGADPSRKEDARHVLEELERRGLPNYFGEQRFGRGGRNSSRAREWIVEGGRAPRDAFERKLFVSTLQSELFNALCGARVRERILDSVIEGDLCRKEDTGGLFVSTDRAIDAKRAEAFEISATGPMFGAKMRWPEGEAQSRERQMLEEHGLDEEKLARVAKWGEGTRRPYRVRMRDSEVHADEDGLVLSFVLPAGSYATVVLRELTRSEERPSSTVPAEAGSELASSAQE